MSVSGPGSYIVIIKDEPYEAVLREQTGMVNQTIDINIELKERWYTVNDKKIPEVNILWYVKGVGPETLSGIDTREQIFLLKDYLFGQKTLLFLRNHHDSEISDAKNDYDAAVCSIFAEQTDYEASCKASARFACRILKAKLKTESRSFKESQSVAELAGNLDPVIFEEIKEIISWIQNRSEEGENVSPATLEDAVNAVRSSVALFSVLFTDRTKKKAELNFPSVAP